MATPPDPLPAPVAAQFVPVFLKPEMLHLYRQITALRAYRPVVFCQRREQGQAFPFEPIVELGKPRTHQLRRLWQKQLLGRPITIYRGEARRLRAALEAAEARVLHIYFGHIGVHLLPLLEILHIPALVSFHGADVQVELHRAAHRRLTRELFEGVRLVLVRSESLARGAEALGCPRDKIRLHRTGLPLEAVPVREFAPPLDGAWHCVQSSRLIAKKGVATSLEAFALFRREYPAARLTIAGEGPLRAELEATAARLGVADAVAFPGFLSQPALAALLESAHLFLHPSELGADGDQEGVPNGMLEAMAIGLPVAATRHGGIPEAVEHGVTGLLVAERDAAGLARELSALAQDPARYRAISLAGAAATRARFDLAAQTRVLEACYTEAIGLARP